MTSGADSTYVPAGRKMVPGLALAASTASCATRKRCAQHRGVCTTHQARVGASHEGSTAAASRTVQTDRAMRLKWSNRSPRPPAPTPILPEEPPCRRIRHRPAPQTSSPHCTRAAPASRAALPCHLHQRRGSSIRRGWLSAVRKRRRGCCEAAGCGRRRAIARAACEARPGGCSASKHASGQPLGLQNCARSHMPR